MYGTLFFLPCAVSQLRVGSNSADVSPFSVFTGSLSSSDGVLFSPLFCEELTTPSFSSFGLVSPSSIPLLPARKFAPVGAPADELPVGRVEDVVVALVVGL